MRLFHTTASVMPSRNRVEAMVDGIFSVAMTLLVLDIKLPEGLQLDSNAALLSYFYGIAATFEVYVVSFCVLGMFWVGHHYQFRFVKQVDRTLLWINLVFLLFITLIPFTTNLIANSSALELPVMLYAGNQLLLYLMLGLHLRRLRRRPELATAEFTPQTGARIASRLRAYAVLPVLAVVVAFVSPQWGLRVFYLLALLHFVPHSAEAEAAESGQD
jgi:uncharacterized membrane protein